MSSRHMEVSADSPSPTTMVLIPASARLAATLVVFSQKFVFGSAAQLGSPSVTSITYLGDPRKSRSSKSILMLRSASEAGASRVTGTAHSGAWHFISLSIANNAFGLGGTGTQAQQPP